MWRWRVELGEVTVRSRKGRAQRSPIFLASAKPRLGRGALVESCTGSAWVFDIVFRMDGVPEASNQRSCVRPKELSTKGACTGCAACCRSELGVIC